MMPKYGAGNLPPGMVPGGGGYGSGSGIAGQNAGNYGDYGYDMPSVVRGPLGLGWMSLGGLSGAGKNALGVGGPGSYATYLSNTGKLNNPNVYVAPGETAFAATPDYTLYEDYKSGRVQFKDGQIGGLGHDLPYGTIYNGVNVNDPNGINNNWGAGTHANHGGVNLENQQGGPNVANQQMGRRQAEQYYKQMGLNQGTGWTTQAPGQQTDPYQLPQNGQRPQLSTRPQMMNPGQNQISTVGNVGPNAGPRPQQPPNLAPGQQPYGGPAIVPMGRPPKSAFGQQNPTIFNQNFANTPYGQSQLPQNPYRPIQYRQGRQPQSQQWGY